MKVDNDASHAFYLGVELARAQIAWQLNKRYVQDQEIEWGVTTLVQDKTSKTAHREASIKEKAIKNLNQTDAERKLTRDLL